MLRGKVTIEHNVSDQERINIPVTAYLSCGLTDVDCNGEVDIGDIQEEREWSRFVDSCARKAVGEAYKP